MARLAKFIGQDQNIFTPHFLSKIWVGRPKGQRRHLSKSKGDGCMLLAFISSKELAGFARELSASEERGLIPENLLENK